MEVLAANDGLGAHPVLREENAGVQTECMSPRVRYNEELNGYHFPYFREQFINREKLPSGSETFRQVVDEITNDVNKIEIPEKQAPIHVKVRRISEGTMNRRTSTVNTDTAQKARRVSWGKPTYVKSEDATSFNRPRVSSDSAVVMKKVLKAHRKN
ncbi:hypothetical protein DPMN_082038 [Dreissena polymorpha]|uniref:Uncharacterized protein n=1 Tax=Dreissena polymorpha TaxID=45954 RepID=A0A9D4BIE2_DREPO|nr:hypothetical protein DPMN_082038 [Dreissena polymorpha]